MAKMEAKCRKFFDEADVDGTGTLTRLELCKLLKKVGCPDEVGDISSWFDDIDVNNDDAMTFEELMTAINKRDPKTIQECDLRSSFQEMDSDGSGFIDVNELRREFQEQGLDSAMADAILDEVDKNDDGKVKFEEFLAAYRAGN